ncbi:sterol carrier family protein [Streptomyces sp. NPDC012389]|uniref:maleylpyruvate isomerase family mycothiol-dependent enzyme n=1 Tax=unclassified Streptomyces TaxID=2593676 RepID=UPI00081DC38E|nr:MULTISPECIES: maleylpyruvate isomerase family mycothiol-dependent enzyme [unclassified Streptomyces]MYR97473.1 maleylpyruvate isomerase family mycothiol-dependent enzyme [Streptomyces sp. SID4937]MYX14807.1 maleylpyruvate isomerase family mycothiol-dependent enzyme [Streptomyces sp. SID8374]SCE25953.1 TIGR03083 family protein [Streptomyces sp. ScaeMP-e83]
MPPAKKRPRAYDHLRTRTAVLAQFGHVRDAVVTLTPEQLARPTRLGDWTVRELAAHVAMVLGSVSRSLALPEPPGPKPGLTLLQWPPATAAYAARIAEDVEELATGRPDLATLYEEVEAGFLADVPASGTGERLLPTRVGSMRLADFLVTRTVELTVHTDDLNEALGLEIPYDRQALAACTRLLADTLADRAPGGSVEVRVPPFAVVQCIGGPKHTRGTPPNVVETAPLTWLRLATGRTEWARALENAEVSASGERADLAELLPLMG